MTVQIIEVAGNRMALLPEDEYRQLLEAIEDREDVDVAIEAERRRLAGEECVPSAVVDALLAGANPLKIWRQHRDLTQAELGERAGVSGMMISAMEKGARTGSVKVWRALAEALRVSLDDIVPDNGDE